MLLRVEKLDKSFVIKKIFENISFFINEGDKVGLLGLNGVGKTTLLNIITGEDKEYSGSYQYPNKDITIFYGKQNAEYDSSKTIMQLVLDCNSVYEADKQSIAEASLILKKLGFASHDMEKTVEQLSGGMITKVTLAKAIFKKPELLILDEPNNHLDMQQLEELESFLSGYKGTVIMVSHDRKLLDNVCSKIIEMDKNECRTYNGSYTDYIRQKDIELREQWNKYENYCKEREKLKQTIAQRKQWFASAHTAAGQNDFWRSKAKKQFRVVKSKQIALEKLESKNIKKPREADKINLEFSNTSSEANIMMRVEALNKSYENQRIFENTSLIIKNKERYCLMGPNGSGKTTLLNMLCGIDEDYSGMIKLNPSLKVAYYRQQHENLNLSNTILDEIKSMGLNSNEARLFLGCFLIKGDDVVKKVEQLSIGERSKRSLLKVMLAGSDILVLDEPTNHMDVYAKEKIEEALMDFVGAVVFVSHDRYFVEKMSTRILAIEGKKVIEYPGDYRYYKEKVNKINKGQSDIPASNNRMLIENQVSYIAGKLAEPNLQPEQKQELELKYFELCRILRVKE